MSLPPLPTPAVPPSELITKSGVWAGLYTAEQMIAYRREALEEAAEIVDNTMLYTRNEAYEAIKELLK